jgi:ABC-2 type transport system ATP-binding protein
MINQDSTPILELTNVTRRFRQRQRGTDLRGILRGLVSPTFKTITALDGVSLKVARGEVLAYAGANGAGKSTTIKLCTGLIRPETGTVRALGLDPSRDRVQYVGRIGVVFGQRSELWFDQPVSASFNWKRVVWGIPDDRYKAMEGLVRELLGLDSFYHTTARELSLGQRMRADLGLALLHEPELLFLDEPTLGLDALAKQQMLNIIKHLNVQNNITAIVTSHDMSELEQLAGRIVLMHQGRMAFDGDFEKLRREFSDWRYLVIDTDGAAPELKQARYISSDGSRHSYRFNTAEITVADLLASASAQQAINDVETHRPDIDEVIAGIYEKWSVGSPPGQQTAMKQPDTEHSSL